MERLANYMTNETLDFTRNFYTTKFAEGESRTAWNMAFNYRCARLRALVDNYQGSRGYSTFYISKERPNLKSFDLKDLGYDRYRTINAPKGDLKALCREIAEELGIWTQRLVWMKGFNKDENVKTNALVHRNAKHIVNIDLKDFFHQFNRKDVARIAENLFNWNKHTARKFSQLVTYENKLVQGNPVSPVFTNIATTHLDIRLQKFCKKLGLNFSRYADDITISSDGDKIKSKVIKYLLVNIISNEGFQVNPKKITVSKTQMEATGLTIQNGKVAPKKTKIKHKLRLFKYLESKGIHNTKRLNKLGQPIEIKSMILGYLSWFHIEHWEPKPLKSPVTHYKRLWRINAKRKKQNAERRILMCQSSLSNPSLVRKSKWERIKDNSKIFDCKWLLCERHSTTGCDSKCKYFNTAEAQRTTRVESL